MPQVHFSPYFQASLAKTIALFSPQNPQVIVGWLANFVVWKETGHNPPHLTDKSSAADDQGRVFRPYAKNNYRHCSMGLSRNGDPVLAFRVLGNGDIMVVCFTTKHKMFGLKRKFKTAYPGQFPKA